MTFNRVKSSFLHWQEKEREKRGEFSAQIGIKSGAPSITLTAVSCSCGVDMITAITRATFITLFGTMTSSKRYFTLRVNQT